MENRQLENRMKVLEANMQLREEQLKQAQQEQSEQDDSAGPSQVEALTAEWSAKVGNWHYSKLDFYLKQDGNKLHMQDFGRSGKGMGCLWFEC
jgi:hypothetical protein